MLGPLPSSRNLNSISDPLRDTRIFANLGCGPVFICDSNWINLDYTSTSRDVLKVDLLRPLPIQSETVDIVYSSHFLEHVPRESIHLLLSECARILKPGGVIRLVMPDFEEMCRAYLGHRDNNEHQYADFLVTEIIDQSVRRYPGGELGKLYGKYISNPSQYQTMIDFLRHRNGETLGIRQEPKAEYSVRQQSPSPPIGLHKIMNKLRKLLHGARFQAGIRLLPRPFITQNVSFASVGEKHFWLWDYYQLSTALGQSGFKNAVRFSHDTSQIASFPFYPLDTNHEGMPRKGSESMYIEAVKES